MSADKPLSLVPFYWRVAVKPNRRAAWAIVLLMLGSAVLDVLTIGLTMPLLDLLTKQRQAGRSRMVAWTSQLLAHAGLSVDTNAILFALLVAASALFLLRSALFLYSQYATTAVAVRLRQRTKVALMDRFLHGRYEDVSARSRGSVVHDITEPSEAICASIINVGLLLTGLLNAALIASWLLYLSWWVTLVIGTLAVASVQGWRWFVDQRSVGYGRTLYTLRANQTKLQVDAIDGLKVVKAHSLESRMVMQLDALLSQEERPELRLSFFKNAPLLVNEFIAAVIVLCLGAATFLVPGLGLRFSLLAAFLLGIRRIAPAMAAINGATVMLSRLRRNVETIEEVLRGLPQEPAGGEPVGLVREIRLERVRFTYASRPDRRALDEVSAVFRTGSVTAIVGATGSGKSTLANLLIGLYQPQSGAVLVDGHDLRGVDLAAWRQRIGYVSQDVFVFNAMVRDNILLGDARVGTKPMVWAARVAQLHDFIVSLPEGYETVIGDRGLRLSGGQCQRLAIARAVLKRPSVLIFDEATSALDNITERAVYEAISQLHREAIVIVIAHRLSTVKDADQLLVMDAGRVAEIGTHETLMQLGGRYATLYEEHARTRREAALVDESPMANAAVDA